jgi:hypothetical protein
MSGVFVFRQAPSGFITEYFNGNGKGGSTTVNKTEIPPEVLARYNAVNARAEEVAKQPYQEYSKDPNAFVAPLTDTQQAGIQNTNTMAGAAQPYYGAAAGLAAQGAKDVNPSSLDVGQYYNPFTQAVAAPTLQALQQQQATERSGLVNPQSMRSFGGDRSGVVAANLARQQALGTAQAMNPIYQQGYDKALAAAAQQQGAGLAAAQANRTNAQTSAQLLAQLGTGAQAAGLAGAQAQMGAGQVEQQTSQAGLQALYNQFQQKQGYPFQIAQFLSNIATGTGALSGNTSTSTTTGGGGFFSDERLKENIQKVGETNDGQPIYRYNYKGDKNTQIGLLAQEVEKHHPEAVGLAGGYKTVNYKKATEDAVHKADGGSAGGAPTGMGAYSIGAPSAMLSGSMVSPETLAGLAPQKMVGGAGLPIHSGAVNPETAGILSPKATGLSLGSIPAAQAELASITSGKPLWSGPDYAAWKTGQLTNFLKENNASLPKSSVVTDNSSQGGLVSSQSHNEEFSRGGYALGGVPDNMGYMNPALQYYGPQSAQNSGLYGVQLQPMQQRQMLQGAAAPQRPAERNAIAEASSIANLVSKGNDAWKERPDFFRTAEDIRAREEKQSKKASGGLIGDRDHYAAGSYVKSSSNPYGGIPGGYLDETLQQQAEAPQPHMLKAGEMPRQQPTKSGIDELSEMASLGQKGKSVYDFAAKKLAGEEAPKALGSAIGDSVGTTGATGASDALFGGLTDASAFALPEATTAAIDAGITGAGLAGAGEAAAAGTAAAEGAGLAAGAGAAATEAGIPAWLAFLGLPIGFKKGGAVPRHHFATDANVPVVTPKSDPIAVTGQAGGEEMSPEDIALLKAQNAEKTIVAKSPVAPAAASAPRAREPVEAPKAGVASSYLPDFSKIVPEGAKDTLSSENFWVPAIAGLGAMLASPNKTLAGAIGSGLVGGTGAYTGLEKQQADIMKQRYDLAKGLFRGPVLVGNEWKWEDTNTGEMISQDEYQRRRGSFISGKPLARSTEPAPTAKSGPANDAVTTARDVITSPQDRPAPKQPPAPAPVRDAVTPAPVQNAAVVPPAPNATAPNAATIAAPVPAPISNVQPLFDSADPLKPPPSALQIQRAALANNTLWQDADDAENPRVLLPRVAKATRDIDDLQAKANASTANAVKAGERNPEQARGFIAQASGFQAQAEKLRKQRDDDKAQAQAAVDRATRFDIKRAETITELQAKLQMADPIAAQALTAEINKLRATKDVERAYTEQTGPGGGKFLLPPGQILAAPAIPAPTEEQKAAPETAKVDPATGQLALARPIAPAGGGHIPTPNYGPGVIQTETTGTQKARLAEDAEFTKDFPEKAQTLSQARQRYEGLINAFKLFESGSTAATREGWAAFAQTFGYPDIAQKIAAGDTAAIQWVQKISPNLVLDTLKSAQPRFAQSEFNTLQNKGTPEPSKLPEANFMMIKEGLATLNRSEAFIHAWDRASREEGWASPAAYYTAWSKANPLKVFEKAVELQMGNFAGMPLPSKPVANVIYVAPNNMTPKQSEGFAKLGIKPGDPFHYDGAGNISPVPKQQLYSTDAGQ